MKKEVIKSQASYGEYVINQLDSNSIKVFKKYSNTIGALREISNEINFEYDEKWNTRTFGAKLIKECGGSNSAIIGEYEIKQESSGSIVVYKYYSNTIGALREISNKINFEYDEGWNTRSFGAKLISHINS